MKSVHTEVLLSHGPYSPEPKDGFVIEARIGIGGGPEAVRANDEARTAALAKALNEIFSLAKVGYHFDDSPVQDAVRALYGALVSPTLRADK